MKPKITYLFLFLITVAGAAAQDKPAYNENVIVTGSYKPEIEFMPKMLVAPVTVDTMTTLHHNFSYSLRPQRLTALFEPSRIKAARIIAEPKSKLYHNYLRLGMGNYWSPMLEASYNSTANRLLTYGAQLTHHSSWGHIGSSDDPAAHYGANHYSQTGIQLFGRYILKGRHQVFGTLHYDNDYNMFYGFSDTTLNQYSNRVNGWSSDSVTTWRDSIDNADLRSLYNYISLNGGFRSLPSTRSPWNYETGLNIADLMGSQGHNELGIALIGTVSRTLRLNGLKAVSNPGATIRMQWHQYRHTYDSRNMPVGYTPSESDTTAYSHNRTLVSLNPYTTFNIAKFNIHFGGTLSLNQYSRPHTMHTYLMPDVTVSRHFASEALSLTAGAQGSESPNTWNEMRLANPYAIGTDDVRTVRHYTYYLTAHYKIVRRLHLDAKVSYNRYHDYMTYELDPRFALRNVFRPKYESFSQTVLGADLTFVNDEMIQLTFGANYYDGGALDEDTLPGLYHPQYDIHLVTHLNYNDKWFFHLQAALLSEMNADYAYDAALQKYIITQKVPLRYNFNTEIEYRHNRALSFFLRIDNIACQRYQYWLNYPSQKIRFTLGATYTF
ncbi:MAG: TonB-dependent outer membrane receptor precursor [bacterium P3]|nr:MAG: TonB-dependent outer membrane receptor precursor [bacterium P3]KWW42046.1 MAG: TonB-dependent outer membrane receptor precursor [bacterium F083]